MSTMDTNKEKPVVASSAGEPVESGKDWYAWTDINYGAEVDDNGHTIKRHDVKAGEKVDQKKLNLSDEDWDILVNERVVRKAPLPKVGRYQSPKRALIAQANKAMEAALAGGE